MPIQSISLLKGNSAERKRLIADCIQDALVFAGYPSNDRFQKICEYEEADLIVDPVFSNFIDRPRTRNFVLVQIWISEGRPETMKRDIFEGIQENLASRAGFQPSDVMVVLQETGRENSSIYRGLTADKLPPVVPREASTAK